MIISKSTWDSAGPMLLLYVIVCLLTLKVIYFLVGDIAKPVKFNVLSADSKM